jgi:CDP-diglyceride synthetase
MGAGRAEEKGEFSMILPWLMAMADPGDVCGVSSGRTLGKEARNPRPSKAWTWASSAKAPRDRPEIVAR